MMHLTIHLSEKNYEQKKKSGSFNTLMSKEMESITWKVKKVWENMGKIREKSFGMDKKPRVSKGRMSLTLFELSIM